MDNNVLQHGHAQHVLSVPFKCALRFVLLALSPLLNTLSPLFHTTDLDCTHLDAVLDGEDSTYLTCTHQKKKKLLSWKKKLLSWKKPTTKHAPN